MKDSKPEYISKMFNELNIWRTTDPQKVVKHIFTQKQKKANLQKQTKRKTFSHNSRLHMINRFMEIITRPCVKTLEVIRRWHHMLATHSCFRKFKFTSCQGFCAAIDKYQWKMDLRVLYMKFVWRTQSETLISKFRSQNTAHIMICAAVGKFTSGMIHCWYYFKNLSKNNFYERPVESSLTWDSLLTCSNIKPTRSTGPAEVSQNRLLFDRPVKFLFFPKQTTCVTARIQAGSLIERSWITTHKCNSLNESYKKHILMKS